MALFTNGNSTGSSAAPTNAPHDVLNLVGEGSTLDGSIASEQDLNVAGRVKGDITTKGRLVVTAAGQVEGNVKAQSATIAGTVTGTVHVKGTLSLRPTARLGADITTGSLTVDEGAQFEGTCTMRTA
ncbi:MAG: polymer-forming cytoskeletal protein [Bacteroidota bacterium]